MQTISKTAVIDETVQLGKDVTIGEGVIIEKGCHIGDKTHIGHHSVIWQDTHIGAGNRIFPFCSLGGEPQDKKYAGEYAPLVIGDNNTIREYCFFNQGTKATGETRVGHRNWIMAYVHVAHDCMIGNQTILANGVQMAGHVHIDDDTVIGGGALIHQFCRIGRGSMLGGGTHLGHDVPPYCLHRRNTVAVNYEGMRRQGFDETAKSNIKKAYRLLYRQALKIEEAMIAIQAMPVAQEAPVKHLLDFLKQPGQRSLVR